MSARDRRLDAALRELILLPGHLSEWGMNKIARQAARHLCDYFDAELKRHRQDQALDAAWKKLRSKLESIGFCRPAKLSLDEVRHFATALSGKRRQRPHSAGTASEASPP